MARKGESGNKIGYVLAQLLQKNGISQRELSKLSGVDRGYINQLINGKGGSISLETAKKIAKALNENPDIFLNEDTGVIRGKETTNELILELRHRFEALNIIEIPLRGSVPSKVLLDENTDKITYIPLPRIQLPPDVLERNLFALRVEDSALSGDGVGVGDILIVEKEADLVDGSIYIVELDNNISAKHIYDGQDRLRLVSSSGGFREVDYSEAQIVGRVIRSGGWIKH